MIAPTYTPWTGSGFAARPGWFFEVKRRIDLLIVMTGRQ